MIIDRRVNIGQTVVSSLNAPSLFLLAKDLTQMQVWVSVNEADVGRIHAGQPVTFTSTRSPTGRLRAGAEGPAQGGDDAERRDVPRRGQYRQPDGTLFPYLTANVRSR